MIEILFLFLWTGFFCLIGYLSWIKIGKHIKVYFMMLCNCAYLVGIFLFYPRLGEMWRFFFENSA